MKHSITVIFGQEQLNKFYKNEPFTEDEIEKHIKTYSFSSVQEMDAFSLGINEAVGWLECYVVKTDANNPANPKSINSYFSSIEK